MTYVPHMQLTALGTIDGGEQFSFGVAIAKNVGNGTDSWVPWEPNSAVYDDMRDDVDEFWQAVAPGTAFTLRSVKFAPIGSNGLYSGPPVERLINGATGRSGGASNPRWPNQVALACTLHTAGDMGRVKGRFYLPFSTTTLDSTGRLTESTRDYYENAVAAFITALGNQPGLDVMQLGVVVASQGRHNKDGSVRLGPQNHSVTAVSVGRVPDTIRTRRNKLDEYRGTPTAVSQ